MYAPWRTPYTKRESKAKNDGCVFCTTASNSDADKDIFSRYSTGSIPTLVFGCKYYRVGAGTQAGEELETKNLTALICKLTNGQPADVCSQVQDLINEI